MTFQPDKPEAPDILAESQPDLLTNYSQQDTVFGVDHVEFSANENAGKHNRTLIHYDDVVTVPNPDSEEITIYPTITESERIKLNCIVHTEDEDNGSEPETAAFIPFALFIYDTQAQTFLTQSVNIDEPASGFVASPKGVTIRFVFQNRADTTDYQVFITQEGGASFTSAILNNLIRVTETEREYFEISAISSFQARKLHIIVFEK